MFFEAPFHERCVIISYKFIFQSSMFVDNTEELISQKIVVLIRVVLSESQNLSI